MIRYITVFNVSSIFVLIFALCLTTHFAVVREIYTLKLIGFCQSYFVLEIFNSVCGYSSSSPKNTIMQLFSRNFVIWLIAYYHKIDTLALVVMLYAWFISDLIRYLYYFYRGKVLTLLRYNMFIVFYPLGVLIELHLINAVDMKYEGWISFCLRTALLLYLPGFVHLFTSLYKKRRNVYKKVQKKKKMK